MFYVYNAMLSEKNNYIFQIFCTSKEKVTYK